MAHELHDGDAFEGQIASGASESLVAEAGAAERYELLVDDGAGNVPASYDLKLEVYSTHADDFMLADIRTDAGADEVEIIDHVRGERVRVTVTNSTGNPENYRISLETFKTI